MHFSAGVFLRGELKYCRKAALAIGVGSDGMYLLIEVFKTDIPVLCLLHVKLPQASALLSKFLTGVKISFCFAVRPCHYVILSWSLNFAHKQEQKYPFYLPPPLAGYEYRLRA
jgi:hypothetical protein